MESHLTKPISERIEAKTYPIIGELHLFQTEAVKCLDYELCLDYI